MLLNMMNNLKKHVGQGQKLKRLDNRVLSLIFVVIKVFLNIKLINNQLK
jgi:hypothetical protein